MSIVSEQWFDEFVVQSRHELIGYLKRMLRSVDDAQEVAQEAYLRVFLTLKRQEGREHNPKALLYTTARNLAISRIRHQKIIDRSAVAVTVSQELQADRRSPEQQASSGEDLRALTLVLNQLPPKCRKVMMLRMLEGLSQKEIAARLDIAVSTVEKHLAKGLHTALDRMTAIKRDEAKADAESLRLRSTRQ